ncbi:MAG: hypothetical protein HUK18_02370 [Bacteroidales bacterium]|nr:hypothetical protein [Bacteroidales bacterium]
MKKFSRILQIFLLFLGVIALFASCEQAPQMPKPPTYLRLDVKPASYTKFQQQDMPFEFDIPKDAKIISMESKDRNMSWFNISFEEFKFDINVSCLRLVSDTMLQYAVNDCYTFLNRHEKLSAGIVQQDYRNEEKKVYGTTFEIAGRDVVSPYQFYLTDSSRYFVRFALNNRELPNNDSISPIIERLKKDMQKMIESFVWKE